MIEDNTEIGTICEFDDPDPAFKNAICKIKYLSKYGLNGNYFFGQIVESNALVYPVGMISNAWAKNRFSPIKPIPKQMECQHEYIKYVGFNEVKMICKHCNKDRS